MKEVYYLSHQHLLSSGPVTRKMRYHFIQKHRGQFQNSVMFRVLGVRASAFYKWKTRSGKHEVENTSCKPA